MITQLLFKPIKIRVSYNIQKPIRSHWIDLAAHHYQNSIAHSQAQQLMLKIVKLPLKYLQENALQNNEEDAYNTISDET